MSGESKVFVGDIGTVLTVDTKSDVSSASQSDIEVQKPDGSISTWTGAVNSSNYIKYIVGSGDFNIPGNYICQAYIELPTWTGHGEPFSIVVHARFS